MTKQPVTAPTDGEPRITSIGIDPSLTATGVVVLTDGRVAREYVLETTPEEGSLPERLHIQRERIIKIVCSALDSAQEVVVALEAQIWMGAGGHTAQQSAALQAFYQVALWEIKWPALHYLSVNVAQVKKYVGAQHKNQVLLQVFKRWGREYKDDNVADAYVLAQIGSMFLGRLRGYPTPSVSKPQGEVLLKLHTGWSPPATKKTTPRKGKRMVR